MRFSLSSSGDRNQRLLVVDVERSDRKMLLATALHEVTSLEAIVSDLMYRESHYFILSAL